MSLKQFIQDLRERKEIAISGGGEKAMQKQKAMGKLNARQRITSILDEDSFQEYDMFVEHAATDFDMEKKTLQGDGLSSGLEQFMAHPFVFMLKTLPLPVDLWG